METETMLDITPTRRFGNTKKFQDWCSYFFDSSNKITYGNRTQAAIKAYGLDPVTQYNSASCIGYSNYRKLQIWGVNPGQAMLDEMGLGYGQLLLIGVNKMLKGSVSDWSKFMEFVGYESAAKSDKVIAVQNNTNITLTH